MKFFMRIALTFYVITILTAAVLTIGLVWRIDIQMMSQIDLFLSTVQNDFQLKLMITAIGVAFVFLSLICANIISGARQKERTIAFDNPAGRVTISLYAIEDLIKSLALREPDVKEVRANIIATKRGLEVETRVVLKSEVNIPEITARLQETIKQKIQDMIGLEESVVVEVHVMRISADEPKIKRNKLDFPEKSETAPIPFQGYRA